MLLRTLPKIFKALNTQARMKNEKTESALKNDSIEIPIGKYVRVFKRNPWAVVAAAHLFSFIQAQGSQATLVSVVKEHTLYKVTVRYKNQDIPLYITLDGKNLVTALVPLSTKPLNTSQQAGLSPEAAV